MGEVVRKKDRKFRTLTTQWFLHHELVTDPERSEAWHFFATEFLPKYAGFTRTVLVDALTEKLRYHSEQHFGPGSKLNQQIARKILQVYTEESGLGQLGLLRKDAKELVRLQPKTVGEGGYWTDFDWDQALRLGSEIANMEYSGEYGFAETEMFWPTTHMVVPAEQALTCGHCHGEEGRMDWEALGYYGDPIDWGGRFSANR